MLRVVVQWGGWLLEEEGGWEAEEEGGWMPVHWARVRWGRV
jgi:hypothetical protein